MGLNLDVGQKALVLLAVQELFRYTLDPAIKPVRTATLRKTNVRFGIYLSHFFLYASRNESQ
jgi:hypothetical protein